MLKSMNRRMLLYIREHLNNTGQSILYVRIELDWG